MADGCWTYSGGVSLPLFIYLSIFYLFVVRKVLFFIYMIRLIDVSKVFGTGVAGLDEVALSVEKGEFVYLIGHTGSGKTTLLRLLIREMLPTKGSILVDNLDIVGLPNNKISHLR